MLSGSSFIGHSRGTGTIRATQAVNPATAQPLDPPYIAATEAEVSRALALAAAAFATYSRLAAARRASFLRAAADEIAAVTDEIATRGTLETGLPEARLRGETARTIGQLRLFAEVAEEGSWVDARIDTALPDRQPLPRPDIRSMLRPLGPVAIFAASNFPLAFSVAGGDTAAALAAGCPVIVKAHSSHPGLAEIVAAAVLRAAHATAMPEGVFSVLYGSGRELGQQLVRAPEIKAVGFTGSFQAGAALIAAAATRREPIPVFAEMSSINPVVFLPQILAENPHSLAEGLFQSLTLGVGQFCTNPGLVFLEDTPAAGDFLATLKKLVESAAPGVMLNDTICRAYHSALSQAASQPGVTILARAASADGPGLGAPAVFQTNVATFLENATLANEMFGPATMVVIGTQKEITRAIAQLEGQLTGTLHGNADELAAATPLIQTMESRCGRVIFNGFPTGVEVSHAMVHGGPYPATADGRSTSVGTRALLRFTRLVCWQSAPNTALPPELQDGNPSGIRRLVDGKPQP